MGKNLFEEFNREVELSITKEKDAVLRRYEDLPRFSLLGYEIEKLRCGIIDSCKSIPQVESAELEFVDREKFGADIAVKIPALLKEKGSAEYIKEWVPKIVSCLKSSKLTERGIFAEIKSVNIYVNILLSPEFFVEVVDEALQLKDNYGRSDVFAGQSVVLDYSSPNVAKHLHAGHIRSTIIGEVLAKIYEAGGYLVHRLNFVNDWGGMGAIIEAYKRLDSAGKLPKAKTKNAILYEVYLLVRKVESLVDEKMFCVLSAEEKDGLFALLGGFADFSEFTEKKKLFKDAGDRRFHNLEKGEGEEFELWKEMREWSFYEFKNFYDQLGVRHDYTIGESFYSKRGEDLVLSLEKKGEVVLFDAKNAEREITLLKEKLDKKEISEDVFETLKKEITDDIGARVIPLENGRLVVMRKDGRTIYATRDLASVKHRIDEFNPTRMVYEVGEEQSLHFKKLFEASRKLGFVVSGGTDFKHLSHGFYVDAETGKKLSSRAGASNVQMLIAESEKYFRRKYDERENNFSDEEKDEVSKMLAVGSIAFNEIKQDKRFSIAFHKNMEDNIKIFEESGGAYIMYSVARARSILRKCEVSFEMLNVEARHFAELENAEWALIKKVADFPRMVIKSAETDNPAVLAGFLLTLAKDYNSYYENYQVLDGAKLLFPARLLITSAVATVLANGLKLCHAEAPERI